MEWATDTDLQNAWLFKQPLPGSVEARKFLLSRAQRKIQNAFSRASRDLESEVTAGRVDPETVRAVQVELASQVLKNPYGARQLSEATGPFSGSMTFADNFGGTMELTSEMYEDLGLVSFQSSRETGTVPMW